MTMTFDTEAFYSDEPGYVRPRLGPGVSRPNPGEEVASFKVSVKQKGAPRLVVLLNAPSQQAAVMYAQNRWPDARCEAVP